MKVQVRLVNWIVLLIVVAGLAPWAPSAMAEDGTPDGGVVDVVVTDVPAETPYSEPAETESQSEQPDESQSLQSNRLQDESQESLLGPVTVTGITLQCPVATDRVAGTLTVTDPAVAETVSLTLKTTDQLPIELHTFTVDVSPSNTTYGFTAVLEIGDYERSTTHQAVVVGPNGTSTSLPFDLGRVNGLTVCQPEGAQPAVTETATSTATATVTETATVTATVTATETATSTVTASATSTATATASATVPVVTTGLIVNTAGSNLNCRSAPNTTATIIAKLAPNTTVAVRGAASNGWVPVKCGGLDGFVSAT